VEGDDIVETPCRHGTLVLVTAKKRMRCRHCHLTIAADELADGHCPECFETKRRALFDFDDVTEPGGARLSYLDVDAERPRSLSEAVGASRTS